ncbi:hypothetical protein G4B88_005711 [Cannabis sativa]|uniref:Ethylene insensitive 3-like DNA-binding domain-containing protein n=1 Tax=Cannabis sativa TaxID=3483 RepID=A0A7J6GTJ2_CANSA|nr:hypothetical protein G4B88_005711 [Cannabis sativa]
MRESQDHHHKVLHIRKDYSRSDSSSDSELSILSKETVKIRDIITISIVRRYGLCEMGIFEEMGFCGNFDFISCPSRDGEEVQECEPEATVEEDYSDEEMDVDELERRMWRDRMLLRRLKEQSKGKQGVDNAKQRQSQEQARRKKMSRAQDGILKYMLKMMEVCKAQGFVYGIIPEKGKPVTGASDNLRAWWKEKVRFDRNGPAAIASDYDVDGVDDEPNFEVEECKPRDIGRFNIGTIVPSRDRILMPQVASRIKGEIIETNPDFVQKRKQVGDESQMMMDQKIFTCEYSQCPYHDYRLGFLDRTSRNNHQMNCAYRPNSSQPSQQTFGMPSFQINNDKPAVFSLPFSQPKPPLAPQQINQSSPFTGLDIPEDGQKMISDLMSLYDTNAQQRNKGLNPGNHSVPTNMENHTQPQQKYQFQMDDSFFSQGVMGGNMSEQANNISSQQVVFPSAEVQFDQCKAFDSPFDNNPNDNIADLRFSSPFNMAPVEFAVDSLPKQDVSLWYL